MAKRAKLSESFNSRKTSTVETGTTSNTTSKPPAYGVKNYTAERPSTEDDESIQRHIDRMKTLNRKKNKDTDAINVAMSLTFGDRRKFITEKVPSIKMLRDEFPALFDSFQVMMAIIASFLFILIYIN